MCAICGCGATAGDVHDHDHHHPHVHDAAADGRRLLRIERDVMAKNDGHAAANRRRLDALGVFAVNLLSSPGSGKTTLLLRLIAALRARHAIAVIEGDQQTDLDAARIRAAGVPAVQINTGAGCHLDAHMVGHALDDLALEREQLLFIENVGNLVCPAGFDLGEAARVVVLSVTEGEDKPLKYPDMFATADLLVLNKADLLPHLDFDVAACLANALRVNPALADAAGLRAHRRGPRPAGRLGRGAGGAARHRGADTRVIAASRAARRGGPEPDRDQSIFHLTV